MKSATRVQQIICLLFLVLGLLCIFFPIRTADFIVKAACVVFALSAIKFLIDGIRMKRGVDLIASIVLTVLTVICILSWQQGYHLIIDAAGIYMSGCGIILLIQVFLDLRAHAADWVPELIMGILYALTGILCLIFSADDIRIVSIMMGAYLIIQALQLLLEMFFFSTPYNARYYAFRNWLCLPAWAVGMLPVVYYDWLLKKKMQENPQALDEKKSDQTPDLYIYIHTGTYASKLYGHMTFSRNQVAYSYGDYDRKAEKLFHTIGPGTFFTTGSEVYSNNCSIVENSPQFEYGIVLTEDQKQKFDQMVSEILESTTPWKCPLEQLPPDQVDAKFPAYEKNYASRLWYRTGCEFRQYHSGVWAWYSLLGNNCSNFSAAKLNEIGLNIPVARGVVSPGEFFEYFEEAYRDPDSPVISRALRSAQFPETLFPVID